MPDSSSVFSQALSRQGTNAEKYELRKTLFGRDDVLPMWVADMDLPTPDFILDALKQRLEHPILGYTVTPDSVYQAIIDWQAQHGYKVEKSQIVFTHNVANGFFMAVSAFTHPSDAVLVQPPVYPPFLSAPPLNVRKVVEAPLVLINNRYQIDFAAFERAIVDHSVKLFLLCNPQNPSGRVWQRDELQRLAEICLRHEVIMVSDEIHSDLVYSGHRHTPLASLSTAIAQATVTLSSPGKTFNLGGLQIGYALIANPELKAAYLKVCNAVSIHELNLFAMHALRAAYSEQGKAWRDRLLKHFSNNIDRLQTFFYEHLPDVKVMRPEASYLVWLDFRQRFSDHARLKEWLIDHAKLGLSDGQTFGGESQVGDGFMRINLAVSEDSLETALQQIKQAL
ncbi:PatB family C-S lyase [Thiomicrorhabdus sp. zzn3]|uniref:MalY/PatB family protein n=1 Tax=Thiomicrorhabdus sp. zzn3 TaxID=3039775 RepID=UPI0024372C5E|nr:PatB family C-S lyase [Thiomicrorhabdus sp. zzn3]MDG6778676.1 PatB family C-S lyase [Thiomicrorhabdus sp. zzn3]